MPSFFSGKCRVPLAEKLVEYFDDVRKSRLEDEKSLRALPGGDFR
jgi:hypothetical protein